MARKETAEASYGSAEKNFRDIVACYCDTNVSYEPKRVKAYGAYDAYKAYKAYEAYRLMKLIC